MPIMPMKCPKCGLINPEDAMRCDCGYDFKTQSMAAPTASSAPQTKQLSWKRRLLWTLLGGALASCVLLWWHAETAVPRSVMDEAIRQRFAQFCSHWEYSVQN